MAFKEIPSIFFNRIQNLLAAPWRRTLYIMFFAQMMSAVGFSSIFPFLPLYVKELGSRSGLSIELLSGLVFSGQAFTMMLAAPVWGALADRFSRKLMVERACFGGVLILLLMAFARSAEDLVILRAIQGLITGTVAAANALVAASAPREHTGYAMGLLQVGQGAGVALGPLIGGAVADLYGYGAAFFVTAGMLFLSGLLVWLGVKEEPAPGKTRIVSERNLLAGWKHLLATPGVGAAYSLRFLSHLGQMLIVPITPLFIASLLASQEGVNTFTGLVTGGSSAATTLSAVYLGRLGDRTGHRRIVILSLAAAALLYLPQGLVSGGGQLLLLQVLVGIAMGGAIPGISALLARFTPHGEEGAVYGLDNSITSGARTLSPLIGASVAVWLGLGATFAAAGVLFLAAAALAATWLPGRSRDCDVG
jgi:DHA1 family multidrug resistance protein-like MFS transporter